MSGRPNRLFPQRYYDCGRCKNEDKEKMKGQVRNRLRQVVLIGFLGRRDSFLEREEKRILTRQARPATNDIQTAP